MINNIEEVCVNDILFDPNNARSHSDKNLKSIAGSLKKFGQQKPIVVSKDNVVIAGNGTLQAAKFLKWDKIQVIRSNLTGIDVLAYAIADNRTSELANWDNDILSKTLDSLKKENFDLGLIGFDDKDLLGWLKQDVDRGSDKDDIPESPEPISKLGDVYRLNNHVLICGDSTKQAYFNKIKENSVDLLFTDPPYNVDYVGKTKQSLKIKNDKMSDDKFIAFLQDAFLNGVRLMKPGAAFYIAHADSYGFHFRYACQLAGLTVKQCLIWVKDQFVLGKQDYHWQHEPILYGWKDGAAHKWLTDRKQTTLWNFARPKRSTEHPTMKPVDLVEYAIKNSSSHGDVVLDLFGGSGTTLIACENLKRKCIMVEFDPKYCDVIIKRFENYTKSKAHLESREVAG